MEHMLGCNYWDSKSGTDMWKNWDYDSVDDDLAKLSEYGVQYLRVFPNWRDFQPIQSLKWWQGKVREYRVGEKALENEFGIDTIMLKRFDAFCDLAKKHNMKLIVSIITGWMSGRLFVPPALEGKNIINDPEALMWETKFVRGFVKYFKDRPEIVYWDLGNECNNISECNNRYEAWLWTSTIRNAILSEDKSRKIMSGMHALGVNAMENQWTIQDQGELTDILCPHPYPSPTVGGDIEPMNQLRTTLIPTIQTVLYSSIGKKPAMIQECGSFNDMIANRRIAADWIRINMLSGWANGSLGFLWWCAHEHLHLENPPYSWSMVERELGLLDKDKQPKPVALEMKKVSEMIKALPFEKLPKREIDAVCILPNYSNASAVYRIASVSYVLAKQAGIEMEFCHCDQQLPDAKIFFVPSMGGWAPLGKDMLDSLTEKAANGATVYFSTKSGLITTFEQITGLQSNGMMSDNSLHNCKFDEINLPFSYSKKFMLTSIGAEVIAEDTDGTVIFSKHAYKKGYIYFLNFPLEEILWDKPGIFTKSDMPYYKIYSKVANEVIKDKVVINNNPNLGITIHKLDDGRCVVIAINYSDEEQKLLLNIKEKYECIYGNEKTIGACDACIFIINDGQG